MEKEKMYIVRHWFRLEDNYKTIEDAKKSIDYLMTLGDGRKDFEIIEVEKTLRKLESK